MKQKEREIIHHLRKGKRVNISAIARELKLPISTVAESIKRIEEKYITKHTSLLDYNKIGYSANAFLAIKINRDQRRPFLDFLKKQACVNSIYSVNSGYNILAEIVCKDGLDMANWIEDVKSKFSTEVAHFQVLKTEEKERFVPE